MTGLRVPGDFVPTTPESHVRKSRISLPSTTPRPSSSLAVMVFVDILLGPRAGIPERLYAPQQLVGLRSGIPATMAG